MLNYKTFSFTDLPQIFPFKLSLGWGKSELGCRNTLLCYTIQCMSAIAPCSELQCTLCRCLQQEGHGPGPGQRSINMPRLWSTGSVSCALLQPAHHLLHRHHDQGPAPHLHPRPAGPRHPGRCRQVNIRNMTWTTDTQKQSRLLSLLIKK